MNISFSTLTRRFAHKAHSRGGSQILTPYRDWAVLLLGSVALLLVAVLWSLYLFSSILSGAAFQDVSIMPSKADTINNEKLDEALLYFEEKRLRTEDLSTRVPNIPDPSL